MCGTLVPASSTIRSAPGSSACRFRRCCSWSARSCAGPSTIPGSPAAAVGPPAPSGRGAVPIAMVIWESRALPRWAGLLYLIHAPLLCITATTTLAVEYLGAFFLLLAGIALSWGVRHEEEVVRHLEHHAPVLETPSPR